MRSGPTIFAGIKQHCIMKKLVILLLLTSLSLAAQAQTPAQNPARAPKAPTLTSPDQAVIDSIVANAISEVVVTGRRPFIEQRADRYVVNVASGISTAGRNAVDVLANTPGVMVRDGKIEAMYKEMAIYIDGRPSNISGDQLTTLLNSIQGDNIARIEVITNPSSRYDAAGTGGIIDIRTKKGLQHGFNGSLDAGYRQGQRDQQNAGITLNYRRKRFNVFGNYSVTRTNGWSEIGQTNGTTDAGGVRHLFVQNATRESVKPRVNQSYRAGVDYQISERHIVGVLYNGYRSGNGRDMMSGLTTITPALDGVGSSRTQTQSTADNNGNQLNLNYQGTLAKPGRQLTIDLDWGRFRNSPWQLSDVTYFDTAGAALTAASEHLRHSNPQDIEVLSAKIDFSSPLWSKAKLEVGAKSSRVTNDNNLVSEQQDSGAWVVDAGRTNDFGYSEAIHAGYVNFNQSFGKVNLQAGLRGEYTDSRGNQRTTGEVNTKHYFDLFPTLYLSYAPSRKHRLGASYGRRVMRPNYGQLNPFETKIDAYSFDRGNPDLKPSYIDNVSLSYSLGQSLMMKIDYNDMHDLITQTPVREEGKYGLTRTNFGRRQSATMMINYRVSPVKWCNINLMAMGMWSRDRSTESFGVVDNSSFVAMAQVGNNFTITPTLSAELTGMYQSRQRHTYMSMDPVGNVSLGVRKSFFAGKLSLSLAANDLFYTHKQSAVSAVSGLDYGLSIRRDTRYVSLSARWNFNSGNAKAARRRTSGIEDEKNRAQ
jgi:outer membrane receptor protein involved in Fe transport